MGIYVTTTGFVKKTQEEIRGELEIEYKSIFGNDIDLEPDSPFTQLIGLHSKRESNLWDGLEEIYDSRDPNKSEGVSLDNIAAETGVERLPAIPTVVGNILLIGDHGTTITAGSLIKEPSSSIEFSLDSATTLTGTSYWYATIEVTTVLDSTAYSITIDGTEIYSYTTAVSGDTALDIVNGLKADIDSGGIYSSSIDTTTPALIIDFQTPSVLPFTLSIGANMQLGSRGALVDVTCTTNGPNPVAINTLTEIVTPISGWTSATNPFQGTAGRNLETDEELRIRRVASLQIQGSATDESIKAKMLQQISGVLSALVVSNRTDVTDGAGRPPHSFELVIEGGVDQDIGDLLWLIQPSGIQSYGSTSVIVVDTEGNNQTVYFSRPTPQYLHVRVSRSFYTEETYPADGDTQIKNNIVTWAASNLPVGKDVIYQRLSSPIYDVPGIGEIKIEIDLTPNPGDSPTFVEADLPVASNEIALADATRITVQLLP